MEKQWSLIIEVCEEQFSNEGDLINDICVNSFFCFENLLDLVKFIELHEEYSFVNSQYTIQQF